MVEELEKHLEDIFSGKFEALSEPRKEVNPEETVLGILQNQRTKTVYSRILYFKESSKKKFEDLKRNLFVVSGDDSLSLMIEIQKMSNQMSVLDSIFWEMIRDEFPDARRPDVSIGVRQGWKVVIFEQSNKDLFLTLKAIFGGGGI